MNSKSLLRLANKVFLTGPSLPEDNRFHAYVYETNIKRLLYISYALVPISAAMLAMRPPGDMDVWSCAYALFIVAGLVLGQACRRLLAAREAGMIRKGNLDAVAAAVIYATGLLLLVLDTSGYDRLTAFFLCMILPTTMLHIKPWITGAFMAIYCTVSIVYVLGLKNQPFNIHMLAVNILLLSIILFYASRLMYGQMLKAYYVQNEINYSNKALYETNRQLIKANVELKWLSMHDAVTGIPNRQHLNKYLDEISGEEGRYGILMIDIDLFKNYNDSLGHSAGDMCLKQVAEVIQLQATMNSGFAARYGGEEFVAILPCNNRDELRLLAEAMRMGVQGRHIAHPSSYVSQYVTVSIGGAMAGEGETASYITLADEALYAAKERGRNNCAMHKDRGNKLPQMAKNV